MSQAPGPSTGRLVIAGLRPPLRDTRFWIVQGLVIVIAVLHEAADARALQLPVGIPDFATVSLFLVPIIYAALNFGLTGSFATAAWVTALSMPDFVAVDRSDHHWVDGLQLVIIDTVAVFVGLRVEQERTARHRAEEAQVRAAAYAAQVVEAQEEERRRIAHELHDDPLQALIHVARRLDAVSASGTLPPDARAQVTEAHGNLRTVIDRLREMAQGLRPPVLDDLGLVAAVRKLVQEAGRRSALDADFESSGTARRLPEVVELNLFRIAQEALSNVERHAAARSVRVRLDFGRERVHLSVSDDGVGFDGAPAAGDGHLGLLGMQERAAMLGGRVEVRSAEGHGATVVADVPAEPKIPSA